MPLIPSAEPVQDNKTSPEDVLDFLKDDKVEDKKDDKSKDDKNDEKDEDDEKVDLVDNEDDEKLDLEDKKDKKDKKEDKDEDDDEDKKDEDEIEIETPPRKREVLAKYPNFYKDFPWFEKMQFRDKQYTELFGSFDDAKETAERARVLDSFESDLADGNTEKVLKIVKEQDPKAFDKIVDNYLLTLSNVDKDAYYEIIGNVGKSFIANLVKEAKSLDENSDAAKALKNAALTLNQFLFGTNTYSPPKTRVNEDESKKTNEIEDERKKFMQERFEVARDELQTKVDYTLRATISDYIDRNNEMSAYIKKNAIKDAIDLLHESIDGDKAFTSTLDKLWKNAFNDKFSKNSLDRIRSTYLGRAKQLLPIIIKKARAEALKDLTPSSRKREEKDEDETPRRRGPIDAGRPRQISGKPKMEKGESVLDFLSRD